MKNTHDRLTLASTVLETILPILPYGSTISGLSEQEATARLEQDGYNELPTERKSGLAGVIAQVATEPMFTLLIIGGIVYLLLGDAREALMLLGFVFVVVGITLYQQRKTENALTALRELASPRVRVVRNGEERRIPGREVVCGDLMLLGEGDRISADGLLESTSNLLVDESLLTGESIPVRKSASEDTEGYVSPGADNSPCVYSGTLVVQGQGVARVIATGQHTEVGKIGRSLSTVESERTALEIETADLVRILMILGISLCLVVFMVYGFTRGDWLRGLLAGIALAMALIPEEYAVVLTVFLALGAWRISRHGVLTRKATAIEALGSTTVLCVDKTGTLTQNQLSVRSLYENGQYYDLVERSNMPLPETLHPLVEYAVLASERDPFDPIEKALREFGRTSLGRTEHLHGDWELVREYPLSSELFAMSNVWRSTNDRQYIIAAKGAPEAIIDLCHIPDAYRDLLLKRVGQMAESGLRLLGVARARFEEQPKLPRVQHVFDFQFLGFVGMEDPVRPTVRSALDDCYRAGIRVVMITGDYPGTAQNVARQIGLQNSDTAVTGDQFRRSGDLELPELVGSSNIFARMVPEDKLRLVRALKSQGEVVAMTGDGVNDAPALKAADIGIAMGRRGTDVAREAADLVLLDDDFSSIVDSVKLGRRIFDNMKKAMAYILAIHVPIAGLSLIPVLLLWPFILLPVHIAFLELIIDPACSIVFEAEPEEEQVMNRPPRALNARLIDRRTAVLSFFQGFGVLVIVLALFIFGLYVERGAREGRAIAFTALVVANLSLILTNRSWTETAFVALHRRNMALWVVSGTAVTFLAAVLYVPILRDLFRFSALSPAELATGVGAGLFAVAWFEVVKAVLAHRGSNLFTSS